MFIGGAEIKVGQLALRELEILAFEGIIRSRLKRTAAQTAIRNGKWIQEFGNISLGIGLNGLNGIKKWWRQAIRDPILIDLDGNGI